MTIIVLSRSILKGIYTSFLLSTINFAIASDDLTANTSSAPSLSLSEQSQQFWQAQQQDASTSSPSLSVPATIRSGRAVTEYQNDELEKKLYRQYLNSLITSIRD